jgi:hypothetical protein
MACGDDVKRWSCRSDRQQHGDKHRCKRRVIDPVEISFQR